MPGLRISVGALTDLCRTGDINFRFSGKSTAIEGIRGHQSVQKSRGPNYESEKSVVKVVNDGGLVLTVSGRVDGLFLEDDLLSVEEIKTIRVPVRDIPQDVMDSYWLQAMLYGHMVGTDESVDHVQVCLCFYNLDTKNEDILTKICTAEELAACFTASVQKYFNLVQQQQAWRATRVRSTRNLEFPYEDYRAGQRDMAVSVYKTLSARQQLVMQAPTGSGKTMATLYPAIMALAKQGDSADAGSMEVGSRIFYLSAKTSTQHLAEKALRDLADREARIRTITITAKDKVCFSPGEPCHPDHCEYAKGYYDRIGGALDELLSHQDQFDRAAVEVGARKHQICPFELSLDLSTRCDVIVSDYNYVFDPVVYLRRFFEDDAKDSFALIDEAHNLVDRGREMFSAAIFKSSFLKLAKTLKTSRPALSRAATAINKSILDLRKQNKPMFAETGSCVQHELPHKSLRAMSGFCLLAEDELRNDTRDSWRDELLDIYFSLLRFIRTAERFGADYVCLLNTVGKDLLLKLYCVDPSVQLGEGYDRLASSVSFSATMTPRDYFDRLLGIRPDASWYRLESPFPVENLQVNIAPYIDTSYKGREGSIDELIELVHKTITAKPGSYLVFFPSYQYMNTVFDAFVMSHPDINVRRQERNMDDTQRMEFIESFDGDELCGFAVMGGVFSEGVDLKGNQLIGAIVVGVGLPQIGIERDLVRNYFPESGYEYAYQYPGMTRVLQTAGRVIRDVDDEGVVCLVDRRYRETRYQRLFAPEWQVSTAENISTLSANLSTFWNARRKPGTSDNVDRSLACSPDSLSL